MSDTWITCPVLHHELSIPKLSSKSCPSEVAVVYISGGDSVFMLAVRASRTKLAVDATMEACTPVIFVDYRELMFTASVCCTIHIGYLGCACASILICVWYRFNC
jgi:hypothetical protein